MGRKAFPLKWLISWRDIFRCPQAPSVTKQPFLARMGLVRGYSFSDAGAAINSVTGMCPMPWPTSRVHVHHQNDQDPGKFHIARLHCIFALRCVLCLCGQERQKASRSGRPREKKPALKKALNVVESFKHSWRLYRV